MIKEKIFQSLNVNDRLNVYVHVPFCNQICGFCNLYTTTVRSADVHSSYVDRVIEQIHGMHDQLPIMTVPTIYLGGGTPTALSRHNLGRLVQAVKDAFPKQTDQCEVAIEVDPQTVNIGDLKWIRSIGINRINLGLQTRDDGELKLIGRKYRSEEQWRLARDALSVGFLNVCVDLIYGLPGQTIRSWQHSVDDCVELSPQTICCYPLTERPHTGFSKASRLRSADSDYQMWEYADTTLRSAGFERQSHVRWARPGGGYIQKQLHWGLENLIGFGAGARSYLWDIDVRTSYSMRDRSRALRSFMDDASNGDFSPRDGFLMDADERLRKAVILGLHSLNCSRISRLVGADPAAAFRKEFDGLSAMGLLYRNGGILNLTDSGMKYRDLIVQLFFSDRVRQLTNEFDYNE